MKFTPHLPNGKAGTQTPQHTQGGTQKTQHTPHSKSDSLPAGVTKEFLNSLTDEKGQKIIQNEDPKVMQCRKDSLQVLLQAISSDIQSHQPVMLMVTDMMT
ncbi:MAG: hypothetical protein IPP52_12630 [Ignavibacteria bacterium]|nr:hypothetical protein [Ignavibacteria bacterium]